MTKTPVLNWYAKNPRYTKGLRKLFTKRKPGEFPHEFVTIRNTTKWAKRLDPGDRVAISISDDPAKPNIIGYAEVGIVKKSIVGLLENKDEDLKRNIGAKSWGEVADAMKAIYGVPFSIHTPISIIELFVKDLELSAKDKKPRLRK